MNDGAAAAGGWLHGIERRSEMTEEPTREETRSREEGGEATGAERRRPAEPIKRHGDALVTGTGSRHGTPPEAADESEEESR